MTSLEIRHAYRHLYKAALQAVMKAAPAKHQIRDSMRNGFRNEPAESFNAYKVENTLQFLKQAEKYTGIEHKILKNLCHVKYWQNYRRPLSKL